MRHTFCDADHKKLVPRLQKNEFIAIGLDAEQRPLMNRVAAPFFLDWTDLKMDYETFSNIHTKAPQCVAKMGKRAI
jgi:hypothetical protein